MQCPLCGGPLHVEDGAHFRCERGHDLDPETMRLQVGTKVTSAFWMAIEALESEATALRMLATMDGAAGDESLADQAEEDARVLRELAAAHLPPELSSEAVGGD
ncbi:MAG: hypothetical protein QOJ00_1989 [Actinomycetota bacterium]|jgi:hypothetical protein